MASKKKLQSAIAICIQEPTEDGSSMDLGIIKGDDLRFLHQAFITDTIISALAVDADVRAYYIDAPDRKRFVKIITEYLSNKLTGEKLEHFQHRYAGIELPKEGWGSRIETAFKDCFAQGYTNVLVLGSRTPTVTPHQMKTALKMLKESDAVFGPTPEGRYYAIGMSGACKVNLSEFDWKSASIYHDVSGAFTQEGLSWAELEIWYAVEGPDELEFLARDINQFRFEGDEATAHETEKVMERIIARLEM